MENTLVAQPKDASSAGRSKHATTARWSPESRFVGRAKVAWGMIHLNYLPWEMLKSEY